MTATSGLKLPIYLDYQATTPMDPRVLAAMMPYFTTHFGNPHSKDHSFGWRAEDAVNAARAKIATLIGADDREIVFTSGATEANNLALKGVARLYRGVKDEIVTLVTEHKCVLEASAQLETEGTKVTYLPVTRSGLVDLARLEAAVTERTAVVSVMAVHNEIGIIEPLAEIGRIAHAKGALFHTDAAQALGKIPLGVREMGIDLMSLSGHKIYGPKGVGALFVRASRPRVKLLPILAGGGQEGGIRSGTLAPSLCVGFGEACAIAASEMTEDMAHVRGLSQRLHDGLAAALPDVRVNGDEEQRYPGNLNLSFPGIHGDRLIPALGDLAVSSGAACASASAEPSYVLAALGLDRAEAEASIRIGLGRFTTGAEIDYAITTIVEAVRALRAEPEPARPAVAGTP